MIIYLTTDGGFYRDGLSQVAYGSARIQYFEDTFHLNNNDPYYDKIHHAEFKNVPNSTISEVRALRFGLERLLDTQNPVEDRVQIQIDSRILFGWITMGWFTNSEIASKEVKKVKKLLRHFTNYHIQRVPRNEIVDLLGH